MAYGSSARCLLGNHDLHLLAVAHGVRKPRTATTRWTASCKRPDRAALLDWLQQQHLALELVTPQTHWLMVHAGVLPQWTADADPGPGGGGRGRCCAARKHWHFFQQMYGNTPAHWSDDLQGMDRLRVVVNALTRLRFCSADGVMEFETKEGAGTAPEGYLPWFDVPGRQTPGLHLGVWALVDLGLAGPQRCVFAGQWLCVGRLPDGTGESAQGPTWTPPQRHEVHCEAAQTPGTTTDRQPADCS